MDMVIKIIGVAIVSLSLLYVIKPVVLRALMVFFKKGWRVYFAAALRFVLAVVFFVSAGKCENFWVMFAFGMLFLIGGLLIVFLGPRRVGGILSWYQRQSDVLLRVLGLLGLAVGVVIIIYA